MFCLSTNKSRLRYVETFVPWMHQKLLCQKRKQQQMHPEIFPRHDRMVITWMQRVHRVLPSDRSWFKVIKTCVCCRVNRPEHTFSIYVIPSARWHCNKIVPPQKLLTMTSVDRLESPGQDLWKEALLSLFRSGSLWDGLKLFLKNEDDKSRL